MSQTQMDMDASVDILESLLFPYLDDEYDESMKVSKKALQNEKIVGNEMAESNYTKAKFRELMKLAKRNKFLTEESDYGEDEDDTNYDDANPSPAEGGAV
jgi:hypothetical protein